MAALQPPVCDFGLPAPDFTLSDPAGRSYSRDDLRGAAGLLVLFICNHCPFVKAIAPRIARDGAALQALDIGVVAICSNDATAYPDDAPPKMEAFAQAHGFTFPYLVDTTQAVARAYGAVCTPDLFGYNGDLALQYRGRLDASRAQAGPADLRRDLYEAMKAVAETGQGPREQIASIGCSIKWK